MKLQEELNQQTSDGYRLMVNQASLQNLNREGRPKGSANKFTQLRDSFMKAYEDAGGDLELTAFAKKHPKEFYAMVARMLPANTKIDMNEQRPAMNIILKGKGQITVNEGKEDKTEGF